jgi:hypothetical protein
METPVSMLNVVREARVNLTLTPDSLELRTPETTLIWLIT